MSLLKDVNQSSNLVSKRTEGRRVIAVDRSLEIASEE